MKLYHSNKDDNAGSGGTERKVTCLTCELKKCVGRCRWQIAPRPKAA